MAQGTPRKRPSSRRSPTAGNRGQGGKWIWPATRLRIYARDGWRCVWCCAPVTCPKGPQCVSAQLACLDHVVTRAAGGSNAPHNLLTSCLDCNERRGDKSALQHATDEAEAYGGGNLAYVSVLRADILERVLNAMSLPLPAREVAA